MSIDQHTDVQKINEEPARSGVLVYVEEVEGGRRVRCEPVGGFDALAAPSLLELAYKAARANIGLDI